MKLLMSSLLAATLWAGAAFGTQAARADEVVVSPNVTATVQPVQYRRYRGGYYAPRYYGYRDYYGGYRGYYAPYRYNSYRPYWGDGGYVYSPWGGVYFSW